MSRASSSLEIPLHVRLYIVINSSLFRTKPIILISILYWTVFLHSSYFRAVIRFLSRLRSNLSTVLSPTPRGIVSDSISSKPFRAQPSLFRISISTAPACSERHRLQPGLFRASLSPAPSCSEFHNLQLALFKSLYSPAQVCSEFHRLRPACSEIRGFQLEPVQNFIISSPSLFRTLKSSARFVQTYIVSSSSLNELYIQLRPVENFL
jgi:hypothetical protein